MDAAQGFSSQGAGAAVILASTHFGFPLSTTHVINGGVMGAGAAKRFSAVRWGVAGNIVFAWLLTLPAAAAIGALAYGLTRIFGTGALGPVLVTLAALSADRRRLRAPGRARRAGRGIERMTATIVEGKELLETVVASLVAGVGVTFIFSVAIWGVARFADLSRNERPLAAGAAARGGRRWPWPVRRRGRRRHHRDDQQVAVVHFDPCAPLRNVAIIMVLALGVAFAPAGGNIVDAVFTALTMGFLAGIAWMLYTLSRQNQLTLATLSDRRRAIFYGAFGVHRPADRRHRQAVLDRRRHPASGSSCWPPRWRRSGGSGSRRTPTDVGEISTEACALRASHACAPALERLARCRHGPPAAQATGREGPPRSS